MTLPICSTKMYWFNRSMNNQRSVIPLRWRNSIWFSGEQAENDLSSRFDKRLWLRARIFPAGSTAVSPGPSDRIRQVPLALDRGPVAREQIARKLVWTRVIWEKTILMIHAYFNMPDLQITHWKGTFWKLFDLWGWRGQRMGPYQWMLAQYFLSNIVNLG